LRSERSRSTCSCDRVKLIVVIGMHLRTQYDTQTCAGVHQNVAAVTRACAVTSRRGCCAACCAKSAPAMAASPAGRHYAVLRYYSAG
jgi:hypothetical protein